MAIVKKMRMWQTKLTACTHANVEGTVGQEKGQEDG
eukprot:CAMPEP_0168435960 /NCGR_PEP_ID=MMETSP0228-20121227/40686_1 /TAXON_ID=133427 /ORGANISM="Protoceratium reticulatum, Strain CCCM 535 (=CCMP 1889)" /LENGTH=35 /DNA_ID= /DNA_START= /DNA_END= /DNA_ORIENTATION=